MKIRKRDLAALIRGDMTLTEARSRGLIHEDETPLQMQQTDPTMYENDSIDAQIDKFLLDADPAGQQTQESWRRKNLLTEAGEDAPPPPAPDAGGAPPPPPAPGEPGSGKPPPPTRRLDLMSFASDIARLVEKSENLLDVKGAIARRAINYVTKNYDPKQAKDVAQILENNFGVSTEPGSDPYDDETAPFAVGAGDAGSGGA